MDKRVHQSPQHLLVLTVCCHSFCGWPLTLGLPDLTNKNTEDLVKFEFQRNNKFFFIVSKFQNNEEHAYTKTTVIASLKFPFDSMSYTSNPTL